MAGPEDPLTELAASAVQLHECFQAFQTAGFSEAQAMYLVGQMVRTDKS
jgi:hypothetical protein